MNFAFSRVTSINRLVSLRCTTASNHRLLHNYRPTTGNRSYQRSSYETPKHSSRLWTLVRNSSTEVQGEPLEMKENEYAHSLLEKIVSYQTNLIQPQPEAVPPDDFQAVLSRASADGSLEDNLAVLHDLSLFERHLKIVSSSDERVLELTTKITESISSVSDEQLRNIVSIYGRLNCTGSGSKFKKLVSDLAMALKNELLTREDIGVDSLLYFMDFFTHVNRQALSASFLGRFTSILETINKEQSILLLHILSVSYQSHKRHDLLARLEQKTEEFFDSCSAQELAVASLGFYRSRYVLTSERLVISLTNRLLNELDSLSEFTIISMIKIINYSTRNGTAFTDATVRTNMRNITQALLPRLKEFSPSSCTNLFRTSAALHQLNHNLMDALCLKVGGTDLHRWRLKDIAWFAFTFGQYQCMMDEKQVFYGRFVDTLEVYERKAEIAKHPQALVHALVGLSLAGVYPENLINEVMSPIFRNKMKSRIPLDLSRDMLFLDQGVRLERPDYDGLLLPDDFFEQLPVEHQFIEERRLPHDKKKQSKRDELLLQIQSSVDLLCGREMCAEIAFVFKHHNTADVVLKVDENRRPVPVYDWNTTNLCAKDNSNQKSILILVAGPNSYTIYDTDYGYARKLLATHIVKRRQAELLGHAVIEIPYYKWYDKNLNRRQYLMELLGDLVVLDAHADHTGP